MPSYTLTGPGYGNTNAASTNFTLTPSGTITDSITFSDGNTNGTFTPSSLTFTATNAAKTFTYTPVSSAVFTLTVTSGNSYAVSGSPWTYATTGGGIPSPTQEQIVAVVMATRVHRRAQPGGRIRNGLAVYDE